MMNLLDNISNGDFEEVGTKTLDLKGETNTYKTYRIPLDMLKYNRKNDRIASFMTEIEATNQDITEDKIESFIFDSAPADNKKTMANIKATRQRESAVVMSDGTVIDGNRRFTCLRKLSRETNDDKYGHIIAVVLDKSKYEDKDVKKLELQIQNLEEKVSYNPIDRYVGVYRNLMAENKEFTISEYAQDSNQSVGKVQDDIIMAGIMIDFLDFIGKPLQFNFAREQKLDGTLNEMKKIVKSKGMDEERKQAIKETCFSAFMSGYDSKKIRSLIDSCKNDKVFTEDKINDAKKINAETYQSFHDDGYLNKETKQSVSDFSKDIIEEFALSKEKNKEEKLVDVALNNISKVDIDDVNHMSSELKSNFINKLNQLKNKVDNLSEFINAKR